MGFLLEHPNIRFLCHGLTLTALSFNFIHCGKPTYRDDNEKESPHFYPPSKSWQEVEQEESAISSLSRSKRGTEDAQGVKEYPNHPYSSMINQAVTINFNDRITSLEKFNGAWICLQGYLSVYKKRINAKSHQMIKVISESTSDCQHDFHIILLSEDNAFPETYFISSDTNETTYLNISSPTKIRIQLQITEGNHICETGMIYQSTDAEMATYRSDPNECLKDRPSPSDTMPRY